jgi:hypothetical protein
LQQFDGERYIVKDLNDNLVPRKQKRQVLEQQIRGKIDEGGFPVGQDFNAIA